MRFKEYLLSMGYRPFCGQVDARVFAFFHCPHAERAVWYVNRAMCSFQCMGCPEQCETDDPQGFQPFLPLDDDLSE